MHRVRRVVRIRPRRVERREDRVALELVDHAVVPLDRLGGGRVELVQRAHQRLGRQLLRERREALDVEEQHGRHAGSPEPTLDAVVGRS